MHILHGLVLAPLIALGAGCTTDTGPDVIPPEKEPACSPITACDPGDLLLGCKECLPAAHLSFDLDACSEGLESDEIERSLEVSMTFAASFADLATKVRLAQVFNSKLNAAIGRLAQEDITADLLPESFAHSADGAYRNASGDITLKVYFGKDYEAGKTGELIVPTLFRAGSYLQGAKVTLEDFTATVSFSGVGPLVELLGFGTMPPNPFKLGILESDRELRSQEVAATLQIEDARVSGARAGYDVLWRSPVLLDDTFSGNDSLVATTVANLQVKGLEPGQKVEVAEWDIGIAREVPLRGRARLAVSGGALPHITTVVFDGRTQQPAVFVGCP